MSIVNVKFNITTDQVLQITNYLGYQVKVEDPNDPDKQIDNPVARKVFLYGKVKQYLSDCFKAEKSKQGDLARISALEQADIDLTNLDVTE